MTPWHVFIWIIQWILAIGGGVFIGLSLFIMLLLFLKALLN